MGELRVRETNNLQQNLLVLMAIVPRLVTPRARGDENVHASVGSVDTARNAKKASLQRYHVRVLPLPVLQLSLRSA